MGGQQECLKPQITQQNISKQMTSLHSFSHYGFFVVWDLKFSKVSMWIHQ